MRKVTKQIAEAFFAQRALKVSNTHTDGQAVWLHGNKIAERRRDGVWISLAGWNTNTTRERLNGLLQHQFGTGTGISQVKGRAFLHTPNNYNAIGNCDWINLQRFDQGEM